MTFAERLSQAVAERRTPCVLGLDPHTDLLPPQFAAARDPQASRAERARACGDFLLEVLEIAAERVPAVKPQSAFFERFGADGARQWERVLCAARDAGLLVIGDLKRNDIASTARAYAEAHLGPQGGCDAITINPYLGSDSVEPFLDVCEETDCGVFVLVRTSNPGSAEFQGHGEPRLADVVADAVARWGERPTLCAPGGLSSVGAVVGATHAEELARFRARMPRATLLLPGFGAQGATARDVVPAFLRDARGRPHGALVNASRSVAFPWRGRGDPPRNWRDAVHSALEAMVGEVGRALGMARGD